MPAACGVSELVALPAQRRPYPRLAASSVRGKGEQGAAGTADRCRARGAAKLYLTALDERDGIRRGRVAHLRQPAPRRGCFPADSESGHLTRQAFARGSQERCRRMPASQPRRSHPHRAAPCLPRATSSRTVRICALIQELLGHADIATTRDLQRMSFDERMKALVRRFAPALARMDGTPHGFATTYRPGE